METLNRKEKEKICLHALGLKVGDKIMFLSPEVEFEIVEEKERYVLISEETLSKISFTALIETQYKKVITKKKKGELICGGLKINCISCPLFSCCSFDNNKIGKSLGIILETQKSILDSRIYDVYRIILDEEIECN